jgi:hypothetical protein
MSYGDGGFYFLQPVSQPAGAYGSLGSYGSVKGGKRHGRYQVLYQNKPYPETLEDYKIDVEKLRLSIAHLKAERAKVRAQIKKLRKDVSYSLSVGKGVGTSQLQTKLLKKMAQLAHIKKALPIAMKNHVNARKRQGHLLRSQGGRVRAAVVGKLARIDMSAFKRQRDLLNIEQRAAEEFVEDAQMQEAEADIVGLPEDEPMVDEQLASGDGTSFLEEYRTTLLVAGGGIAAFLLYKKMMK